MVTPILIVDDSVLSRKLVIKALPAGWDVEIHQAGNGQEALEIYRNGKAHVIFLDLNMPVMDGFEVLETIKRDGLNAFIIVISADIQPKAQERVKKLGAIAFLKKPVKTEEIKQVLTTYGILA